jgi:hypothetical protein
MYRDPRIFKPAVGSYTERVLFDWLVLDRKRRPNWSVIITLGRRTTRACSRPALSGLGYNTIPLLPDSLPLRNSKYPSLIRY